MTGAPDFGRYRTDPLAFIGEVLGVHLYSRQREIVEAVRDHERVAVKSGNATGKTTAAAVTMLAWLAGGPGRVVVSTSATDAQLRRVLWRETRGRFKAAREFFAGATVTDTEIFIEQGWFATGFSTDTPEALQGVHAEGVLVVVDEASALGEDMYDAVEGVLAGGDAKLLLIGNPLRTSGTFFDAFNTRRDEFHALTISAYDTPAFTGEQVPRELRKRLVSKGWVERIEKHAAGSNTHLVKVLGEFPSQADDTVVARADLEKAHANAFAAGLPVVIGVDPARFGSDETAVAVREGNRIRIVRTTRGHDLMRTTGYVADLARRLQTATGTRPTIVVDEIGVGSGVVDRLQELREFKVLGFNSAGRAERSREFHNRRSELWITAGEAMGQLDLDPRDDDLAADLLSPTFSFGSDGARVVEPKSNTKKRLRRSPDRADALLLTLVVSPPRVAGQPRPRGYRRGQGLPKGRIDTGDPVGASLARRFGFAMGAPGGHTSLTAGARISGEAILRHPRRRRAPLERELQQRALRDRHPSDEVLARDHGIDRWSVERGRAELDDIMRRGGGT